MPDAWCGPKFFTSDEKILVASWAGNREVNGHTILYDAATGRELDEFAAPLSAFRTAATSFCWEKSISKTSAVGFVRPEAKELDAPLRDEYHWSTEGYGSAEPEVEFHRRRKFVFHRPNNLGPACEMYDTRPAANSGTPRPRQPQPPGAQRRLGVPRQARDRQRSNWRGGLRSVSTQRRRDGERHCLSQCAFANVSRRFDAVIDKNNKRAHSIQIWNRDEIPASAKQNPVTVSEDKPVEIRAR